MNKKVVISGYYGFNNFGDEAVLSVLIDSLKQSGIEDITVFSHNPKFTSDSYNVKASKTFDIIGIFKNIIKSDFLISGGGSLLQDVTSLKSLIYYLMIIIIAQFFGKKVIIFAQGIGPINNGFFRFVTKFILKRCKFVSVRDEQSLFLLRSWGLNPLLVSDPVWSVKLQTKYSHHSVGVQLRKWHTLTDEKITELAKSLAKHYSDKIIFIYALQESLDLKVCEQLEEEILKINKYAHIHVVTNRATKEIINAFSHLDELIAMRYHACLIGLKYGIKVLPIVYDPKVEKLSDEFNIKDRIYLEKDTNFDLMIEKLRKENSKPNKSILSNKTFDFEPFKKVLLEN